MSYKNNTQENIKYRVGSPNNYIWKTIRPGEVADVPEHIAEHFGLIELKEAVDEKAKDTEILKKEGMLTDEPFEETLPGYSEEYKKKEKQLYKERLESIKGIGKKTAEDIIKMYPTEEKLVKSIKAGKELPIRDDLTDKIKKAYTIAR